MRYFQRLILLMLALMVVFACTTTPSGESSSSSSSTMSTSSSVPASSSSSTPESSSSSTPASSSSSGSTFQEVILLFSEDTSLGTPMDIDFNNPQPTTIHEMRFDPWDGGNAYASRDGTPNLSDEHSYYILVTVSPGVTWGGCGFQLTNNARDTGGTNLIRFTNGYVCLDVNIPPDGDVFKVTIENGTYPTVYTSAEITIGNGSYGEAKDGNWHTVMIPVSSFFNSTYTPDKLAHVASLLQIRTIPVTSTKQFKIDRIYWAR
ncbi:MAG: hypothetical protein ACP5QT_02165 [Brevinematia bacterium]